MGMSNEHNFNTSLKDIPDSSWQELSKKKIYFGHHSVGFNILDGINQLAKENPQLRLNIVETSNVTQLNEGVFAHSRVGKNRKPLSKIAEFRKFIDDGIGGVANLAIFKFCFVDIVAKTDVNGLFEVYEKNITRMKASFPETTFVHFTVPLKVVQTGFKAWIKSILGKQIGGYANNIKRNEFNKLLREKYQGKDPIFDLAMFESTNDDGTMQVFEEDGKSYFTLRKDFTDDGGHLNTLGRRKIAEQFLIYLSGLD